jgi:hypothetical protein
MASSSEATAGQMTPVQFSGGHALQVGGFQVHIPSVLRVHAAGMIVPLGQTGTL